MIGRTWMAVVSGALAVACGDTLETVDGSGTSGDGGGGNASAAGAGGGGGEAPLPTPAAEKVPTPTATCPTLQAGVVTFSPAGIDPRDVQIYTGDGTTTGGPLIFYWHGNGGQPTEAPFVLGNDVMAAIQAAGGVLAAPFHDPGAGQLPWYNAVGAATPDDDLRVADEVVACALEQRGIDVRRIHSTGFSAGGLQTTQLAYLRSNYLASVVIYSGGRLGAPEPQDPSNKLPAMIVHGGPSDVVIISFQDRSQALRDDLVARGHFAFLCNHDSGHTVPPALHPGAWQFFQDHPYGVVPSPYAEGLPAVLPAYCTL